MFWNSPLNVHNMINPPVQEFKATDRGGILLLYYACVVVSLRFIHILLFCNISATTSQHNKWARGDDLGSWAGKM